VNNDFIHLRFSQILAILWLFLPVAVGIVFQIRTKRFCFWKPFLVSSLIGYVLIMASARVRDGELKVKLYELDINKDGVFTGEEITPEVNRRMMAVASDTGRTFAPVAGFPISAIWSVINLGVLAFSHHFICSIKKKVSTSTST
jgi:hypothetical protein